MVARKEKKGEREGTAPFISQTGRSSSRKWFSLAGGAAVAGTQPEMESRRGLPPNAFVSASIAWTVRRALRRRLLCTEKDGNVVLKCALFEHANA